MADVALWPTVALAQELCAYVPEDGKLSECPTPERAARQSNKKTGLPNLLRLRAMAVTPHSYINKPSS